MVSWYRYHGTVTMIPQIRLVVKGLAEKARAIASCMSTKKSYEGNILSVLTGERTVVDQLWRHLLTIFQLL